MIYKTFKPHKDLASIVKFYWTLEVPFDPENQRQTIVPDGCVEMTFSFGDKIKRFTSENDYVLHPDCMVMGQRTRSFDILPVGNVDTFAICFYPVGFANFVNVPLENLVDKETPVSELFGETEADELERQMTDANGTTQRIACIEAFLLKKLTEKNTISTVVKSTVDILLQTNGTAPIHHIVKNDASMRRKLERHFRKQIGISPKQLGRAIRLQATLHMMLTKNTSTLTDIAYESDYFDQNHFIKDFKDLVGLTPKAFSENKHMELAALFYK